MIADATAGRLAYRQRVEPSDGDNIRLISESSGFFSPEEVDIAVELLQERLEKGERSGYHFIFVQNSGETIGYSCYGPIAGTDNRYDIYWIAVREDFRGRGIGRDLLRRTEEAIAGAGGKGIYIETSSTDLYLPTRKFYLACGYREAAVVKDFYSDNDSKVIYSKSVKRN